MNNLLVETKDVGRNANASGTLRERPYRDKKSTVTDRAEYRQNLALSFFASIQYSLKLVNILFPSQGDFIRVEFLLEN